MFSVYDRLVSDIAMRAALTRSASATGSAIMGESQLIDCQDGMREGSNKGENVRKPIFLILCIFSLLSSYHMKIVKHIRS